ncbi:autotransporter domain-containing protein [Pararobbsia silviterrae]|uniref:Autotransporter domain-containing protein n=1 Tax=Pararobbsia silviterrae TaxID=1792498 RepID=A0A494Y5X5_9BURK|nr:autotransporter domain-containing protein [Pararobbsia silviterrae]RKP57683.1 autotransporter domain-containing protein [Pararobbsia silviterrae]
MNRFDITARKRRLERGLDRDGAISGAARAHEITITRTITRTTAREARRSRWRPSRKPLVYAVQSAMVVLGSLAAPWARADMVVGSGTVSGSLSVQSGTTTNIEVDEGGSVAGGSNIGVSVSGGTVGTLLNNGTIGGSYAIDSDGTITTLTNGNIITGTEYGIQNELSGHIGTLTNSGTLSGGIYGIINSDPGSTIDTVINTGTIESTQGDSGLRNGGTITTVTNKGTISGGSNGVYNWGGVIGTLTNTGTITGGANGIANSVVGIYGATFGTIANSGLITSSSGNGIYNDGSITLIDNAHAGTISGPGYAIYNNGGTIGAIANSGLIAGNIANVSSNPLTITGSTTAGVFGTLTGYDTSTGAIGTITNTMSNLDFGSGNILLNDNVNVGSYAVTNSGNLAVSNLITIDGDYVQTSSGTLTSNVAHTVTADGNIQSDTGYGRIDVTGQVTFESGASVKLTSTAYAFASGQRFVVIEGNGNSTFDTTGGTFTASGFAGIVTAAPQADGANEALVLSLSGRPAGTAPTTQIATATLTGLQRYSGIQAGLLELYDASLGIGSTAQANHVGAELAPTQNFSAGNATSMATLDALNVVNTHVDALRYASSGSGISTGDGPANWAAWGQFYGGHADQGTVDGGTYDAVSGYTSTYGGLMLGADRRIGDRWRAGGAFAYSNTAVYGSDDETGDSAHVDSYGWIGYASYSGDPWYVNLSASATLQKYRTSRLVSFAGFSGDAEGQFDGSQYVARAEYGYPIALPKDYVVTPIAALSYSAQIQDAYTESGGNGAALAVDGAHADALRSSLGAKLDTQIATHAGDLVPFAELLWTHQYNNGRPSTIASYAADTSGETGFMVMGATPARDVADIHLGADLLRSDTLSVALRYDVQAASSYFSQALSVRVREQF